MLFDAEDRLVMVNDVYRQINPAAQEYLERGMHYEDLIRANIKSSRIVEAIGREEAFIKDRLRKHRNPKGPIIRQFSDGQWYILKETRTPEGQMFSLNLRPLNHTLLALGYQILVHLLYPK